MNDRERMQWIDNDEGLYSLWRHSAMAKSVFVQEYREILTRYINGRLCKSEDRPAIWEVAGAIHAQRLEKRHTNFLARTRARQVIQGR